jgi:nucleoside-triphosphatase THEP1
MLALRQAHTLFDVPPVMSDSLSPPAPPAPGLLIAVTGGPGSRKTHLLTELAASQIARGHRVEGVLALAGRRRTPTEGADEYWLRVLGTEQELLWAVRNEQLNPPYAFDPVTEKILQEWAARQSAQPPAPLLVLDEFSKFEVKGQGLMPLWPTLAATAPHIAVLAVRAGLEEEIEQRLGRAFDLRIAADAPEALAQLRQACEDFGEWTRIGLFGGAAGGLEMTVGAALHAAKIPLRGLAMSSLQGAMMVFAGSELSQPGRVVWVPFISGGLKALSPAGNRIRPMLAIVMQGLLFGTAVQALGWNVLALGLGGALIGTWAALQGFFLQYLLLGDELIKAYDTVVLWLAEKWHLTAPGLPWLVGAWAALHAVVAATVVLAAWRYQQPPPVLQRLLAREHPEAAPPASPARSGGRRLREFGHWQFWLPLLLVAAITLGGGSSWATVAWLVLRFVAVGCVLMALLSLLRPARWAELLRRRGWWGPALAFSGALRRREVEK